MANRCSFVPVEEPNPLRAAEKVAERLAGVPDWIPAFNVFRAGLSFRKLPSFTPGAIAFERAAGGDDEAKKIVQAMDELYAEVRDGADLGNVQGVLLERLVWHSLGGLFPNRLGPCAVVEDRKRISDFQLDAATESGPPAVGVESKTSLKALEGRFSVVRSRSAKKAEWVVKLRDRTHEQLAAAFVTWVVEDRFRTKLISMLGDEAARDAYVVAHDQLSRLPARLAAMKKQLRGEISPA